MENNILFGYEERVNTEQTFPVNELWTTRKSFWCLYAVVKPDGLFGREVKRIADCILPKLNVGGANTSLPRPPHIIEADNLSGILAEKTCELFLSHRYGKDKVKTFQQNTSINQIDIDVLGKTIEVRSSCIRNGIDFALFRRDGNDLNYQYGDIIGPYKNGYKPGESQKDYYLRAIFHMDISDFMQIWNSNAWIGFHITGGVTRNMMNDSSIYQIKHLSPKTTGVSMDTEYRTIPFCRSLDFIQFLSVLEYENPELLVHVDSTYPEWLTRNAWIPF